MQQELKQAFTHAHIHGCVTHFLPEAQGERFANLKKPAQNCSKKIKYLHKYVQAIAILHAQISLFISFIAQLIGRVDLHTTPANESQARRTRARSVHFQTASVYICSGSSAQLTA